MEEVFITKIYDDSKEGIKEFLEDEVIESEGLMFLFHEDLELVPDPFVKGVWKLSINPEKSDGIHSIVLWLAGYPDPWGQRREHNDWECFYEEDEEDESMF